LYWGLGNTPFAREAAYAEMVQAGIQADQQRALTDATLSGWALGDAKFIAGLKVQTLRRLSKGKAGRPFLKPIKDRMTCP
jgi:putative transposase